MMLTCAATTTTTTAALLNLGCGRRFHPAWTNLDLAPQHPRVQRWDVTRRLPFDDASFDGVYHSHLLEHLPRAQALPFLRECRRVLKPGGVLRMAVPDLEAMARLYLQALDDAWTGDADALQRHRWLVMEMYDQTTRESSGGDMITHLRQEACAFAWHRLGQDGVALREHLGAPSPLPRATWRERIVRWLLGDEYELLQVGRFRRAGEVHQWMYDRVSLRALSSEAGYVNFRCVEPAESAIANWCDYHLDTTADGDVCKPDSLFVEAHKP